MRFFWYKNALCSIITYYDNQWAETYFCSCHYWFELLQNSQVKLARISGNHCKFPVHTHTRTRTLIKHLNMCVLRLVSLYLCECVCGLTLDLSAVDFGSDGIFIAFIYLTSQTHLVSLRAPDHPFPFSAPSATSFLSHSPPLAGFLGCNLIRCSISFGKYLQSFSMRNTCDNICFALCL